MKRKPLHRSHKMTPWRDSIITIISTPRFGEVRTCKKCGGEQAKTVTGTHTMPELRLPCSG